VIEVMTIYGDAEVRSPHALASLPEWAPMLAAEVIASPGEGRITVRLHPEYAILGRYHPRAVPPWDPRGPAVPCLLGEYLRVVPPEHEPLAFETRLGGELSVSPRLARGRGRVYPIPSDWRSYRAILLPEEQYTELLLGGGWCGRPLEVVEQLPPV